MDGNCGRKVLWIREILTDKSGRRVILGVPHNGSDVHVGDVFTKRYEVPSQTHEDILKMLPQADPINRADIELIVAAIEWPRWKASQVLPFGHDGAIQFTGAGSETVTSGCYLET